MISPETLEWAQRVADVMQAAADDPRVDRIQAEEWARLALMHQRYIAEYKPARVLQLVQRS
jgi:hypothetical protein